MGDLFNIVSVQLPKHEGFRARAYRDSEGILTIGYGTNLEELCLTKKTAAILMRDSITVAIEDARLLFPNFEGLSTLRQSVLVNMAYNLGLPRLRAFQRMRKAVEAKDWAATAYEMLDSKWARQVGHRAQELASMMEHDKQPIGG